MAVPKYMNKGSKGPHVTILQTLLCGQCVGWGFNFYQEYDVHTANAVEEFQALHELEVNGNFGPAERDIAKRICSFDFDAACETIPGVTDFVQPDNSVISWWPGPGEKIAVRPSRLGFELGVAKIG